jgi:hypothetical protein
MTDKDSEHFQAKWEPVRRPEMRQTEKDGQKAAQTRKERASGLRGHIPALIALFALAVVAVAWFWTTKKPPQEAGLGAEHGIIVVGAGAFVTAIIAQIRNMDASDVLEMLGELVMGLFALIGAILKGIWNWFLGLIGLD